MAIAPEKATLNIDGKELDLPITVGSEGEVGLDISKLRSETKAITLDPGYGNTGSCESAITFINGEKGILRHRGYAIEDLSARATFSQVAYLLIYGELPNPGQLAEWRADLTEHSFLHEKMTRALDNFPLNAHPMGVLSAMVASLSTFYPDGDSEDAIDLNIRRLLAQVKTIAAFSHKQAIGHPFVYPKSDLGYCGNFLRMMFGTPAEEYEVPRALEEALNMLLIVHADHEQNCSTSTVRMVCSSQANLYASMSAGVSALWGPLHGGANQKVIEMLQGIQADGGNYKKYVDMAKDKKSGFKLMGFGHRVYKNFDPRATILKSACDSVLEHLGVADPLLDIAKHLEQVALEDPFFVERNLYPNVDFYSGIIYRAMGIPVNMFTVLFAIGRMPGWIAHWKEMREEGSRIHRPRQIYIGATARELPK